MPESRDRLPRAVDVAALFARRRSGLGVYEDLPYLERALGSPIRRPIAATPIGRGRSGLGTPRVQTMGGRNMFGSPDRGRENVTIGSARRIGNGRGRASNNIFPSWYPRTPLRTAFIRAMESSRDRLGGNRAQEIETPVPHAYGDSYSAEPSSVARLEHIDTTMSPIPINALKRCPPTVGKVPKILPDVFHKASEDSEFLAPQKKLLNSIDIVEKEVMEELRKLKRTASSKMAQRQKSEFLCHFCNRYSDHVSVIDLLMICF